MSFNAVDFLYLNPELSAYLNITTTESARAYYQSDCNVHLAINLQEIIPSSFKPDIFISTSRDIANISGLSRNIITHMYNQGILPSQINRSQKYIASIYQTITYSNANVFDVSQTNITSSNTLNVGDFIKVIDASLNEYFFQVSNLTPNTIGVRQHRYTLYSTSNYTLYGINATDFTRIAHINYARIFGGYSNIDSSGQLVSPVSSTNTNYVSASNDQTFNADLYRILYPDARGLDDTRTYLDWVNNRKNEIYRINNVSDIGFGNGNHYVNNNFLNISSNLVFRGIFIDGILSNMDASLSNTTSDPTKLVTAYAIKQYTDIRIANLQNLGSFENMVITDTVTVMSTGTFMTNVNIYGSLYVNSNSTFSNSVNILSNLDVGGSVTMRNSLMLTNGNATVSNNLLVNGSMSVTGNLYNARIGLGYMGSYLTSNTGINIVQAQNYNDNSDSRIKKNIIGLSPEHCFDIISRIDITRFTYNYGIPDKDTTTVGCIAQQLKDEGLDEFVYTTEGYIPNIMTKCKVYENTIITDCDIDILLHRDIKLIVDKTYQEHKIQIVKKYERYTYQLSEPFLFMKNGTECILYGYRINDLYNVDYKQLFVLTMGAIKHLHSLLVVNNV